MLRSVAGEKPVHAAERDGRVLLVRLSLVAGEKPVHPAEVDRGIAVMGLGWVAGEEPIHAAKRNGLRPAHGDEPIHVGGFLRRPEVAGGCRRSSCGQESAGEEGAVKVSKRCTVVRMIASWNWLPGRRSPRHVQELRAGRPTAM